MSTDTPENPLWPAFEKDYQLHYAAAMRGEYTNADTPNLDALFTALRQRLAEVELERDEAKQARVALATVLCHVAGEETACNSLSAIKRLRTALATARRENERLREDLIRICNGCEVGVPDQQEAIRRIIAIKIERDDLRTQLTAALAQVEGLRRDGEEKAAVIAEYKTQTGCPICRRAAISAAPKG